MAPKKASRDIKELCIRCPDLASAEACPGGNKKKKTLAECAADSTHGGLWPGFSNDAGGDIASLDGDMEKCKSVLKTAREISDNAVVDATMDIVADKPRQFDSVCKKRSAAQFADAPLSKPMLERAYQKTVSYSVAALTQQVASTTITATAAPKGEQGASATANAIPVSNKPKLEQHAERPVRSKQLSSQDKLITNHFRVTLTADRTLYEYQVTGLLDPAIKPPLSTPKKKTLIRRMIENSPELSPYSDSFAFNGEGKIIAWTKLHKGLPEGASLLSKPVDDFDRSSNGVPSRKITLVINFARKFDFSGLKSFVTGSNPDYEEVGAGQALDILLGHNVAKTQSGSTFQVSNNKFFTTEKEDELSRNYGLIVLRGFSSHVTPANGSVTLNVNTAFSAFYKQQSVHRYMEDFGPFFNVNRKAREHLLHLRVRIMYDRTKPGETDHAKDTEARRTKTITGFSRRSAAETMFTDRNNKLISVWDHFRKEYPRAQSIARDKLCVNTGDVAAGQECWFVADQLEVLPGQLYRSLLEKIDDDGEMAAAMIGFACCTPETNRNAIMNAGLLALGLGNGTPATLSSAGIKVASQMMTIPFRQIPPPKISFAKKQSALILKGEWSTKGLQFLSTSAQIDGNVIFLSAMSDPLRTEAQMEIDCIEAFKKWYNLNGIKLKPNSVILNQFDRIQGVSVDAVVEKIQRAGLAVLMLPNDNAENRMLYAAFRAATDQVRGTPSLVFREKVMQDMVNKGNKGLNRKSAVESLLPYIANNAMKLNTRLGNENHMVEGPFGFLKQNTLIMGADLVHPKPSNPTDVPSIASLVGSIDSRYATFLGSSRRTRHREEIISKPIMKSMAVERITAWRDRNDKMLPTNIIYYRDGTGHTQYSDIREQEVLAIREAWRQVQLDSNTKLSAKNLKLKLTAVVVVKRHTTRFYPTEPNNTKLALKENCLPGTVVESDITSPYYFDFFLQSHAVEKGSAKPTHYFVLENEMKFDQDSLQNVTNGLCYNISHSTGPVSYASPAYLADRLCERASLYLHRWYRNDADVKDLHEDKRKQGMDADWGRGKQTENPWSLTFQSKMFWM